MCPHCLVVNTGVAEPRRHRAHWCKEAKSCSYCWILFTWFSAHYSKLNDTCYLSSFWELFWITLLRIKKRIRASPPPPNQTNLHLSDLLFSPPHWSLFCCCTVHSLDPKPQWAVTYLITCQYHPV